MLVADGFEVGRDQVYRLWRGHGYGVKQKTREKAAFGRATIATENFVLLLSEARKHRLSLVLAN